MKRDDIITILCKLKYCSDDFNTVKTSFRYEFSDRDYEITFERDNGRVVHFEIKDLGEVKNEGN